MRFFAVRFGDAVPARLGLSLAVIVASGCGGGQPDRSGLVASGPARAEVPAEPTGTPDVEVAQTVEKVLGSAQHPALRWPSIGDVAALLRKFYDGEPDRLLWFAGNAPVPAAEGALACVERAADHGLDPADYDAE